jgi:amino acid permease
MSHKLLLEASSTLVGFTIGAGILGLPYVVAHAGFLTGLLNLVVIGCAVLMMNLMLGEAVLRTKEHHQLTGYANLYLGKIGKYLMMICMILGMYGPLIAYILKEGEFFSALLSPIFGGTPFIYSLLFAVFGTVMIFLGLQIIEKSEVIMVLLIISLILLIKLFTIPNIII